MPHLLVSNQADIRWPDKDGKILSNNVFPQELLRSHENSLITQLHNTSTELKIKNPTLPATARPHNTLHYHPSPKGSRSLSRAR